MGPRDPKGPSGRVARPMEEPPLDDVLSPSLLGAPYVQHAARYGRVQGLRMLLLVNFWNHFSDFGWHFKPSWAPKIHQQSINQSFKMAGKYIKMVPGGIEARNLGMVWASSPPSVGYRSSGRGLFVDFSPAKAPLLCSLDEFGGSLPSAGLQREPQNPLNHSHTS